MNLNEPSSPVFKAFDPLLLDSFCLLVEQNNLTKAAEELDVTQPALSKRMRKLQDILQLPLIVTYPSRIAVTPIGHTFYKKAKLLSEFYRQQWLEIAQVRHLSLSVEHELLSYVLPSAIKSFAANSTRPLCLTTGVSRDNIRDVLAGESDLAVVIDDQNLAVEFHSTRLASISYKAVFSATHRLAAQPSVEAKDFEGEALIVPPIYEISRRRLDQFFADAGVRVANVGESVLYPMSLQMVAALNAVAIVPEYCPVPASLTSRPIPTYPTLPYVLIAHKIRHRDQDLQKFRDSIVSAFANCAQGCLL